MVYTTISISKDLKKEILILKATNGKETLEDIVHDMVEAYKEKKTKEKE